MSNDVTQSIFKTSVVERSWKTHITSGIIHVVVIGAAFLITVPVVRDLRNAPSEHVTLVAPIIPNYHPVIEPPRLRHTPQPKPLITPPAVVAKTVVPPPVVIPPVAPPLPKIAAAPVQPRIVAEAKPDVPPAPAAPAKPVVKTGSFADLQIAKAETAPKQVIVGGFGDPRGVQSSQTPQTQPVLMAKLGSFDNPTGSGQTGGGGRSANGVKQSGFDSAGASAGGPGKPAGTVRTGNFGDSGSGTAGHSGNGQVRSTTFGDTLAAAPPRKEAPVAAAAFTPVEILFKPRPSYSAEARGMRLEGQVSLEVVFQASGAVKVVRVIKGLGHGLDEAAQQAALQVRFKPATRGGAPVDTNATISITFEIT